MHETDCPLKRGELFAGRYQIENFDGESVLGPHYTAEDVTAGGEPVNLRLLRPSPKGLPPQLRKLTTINHPRLVRCLGAEVLSAQPYLVYERLEGRSLDELLGREPVTVTVAYQLLSAIAEGLSALHEQGMVHGALYPGHILITADGELKLADYGVPLFPGARLTAAEAAYVAPELWALGAYTPRSDLFALGVNFYRMLTGILPFDGAVVDEIHRLIVTTSPVPPQQIDELLPQEPAELALRFLDKDPEKRPAAGGDVLGLLVEQSADVIRDPLAGRASLPADNRQSEAVTFGAPVQHTWEEQPPEIAAPETTGSCEPEPTAEPVGTLTPSVPYRWGLFLYKLPFALLLTVLAALLVNAAANPILGWLWRAGGHEEGGSFAGGLLTFLLAAGVSALPVFGLAWIFHPLKTSARVFLRAVCFYAALLILLLGINTGRLLWGASQDEEEVSLVQVGERLPQILRYSVQSGLEAAFLAPRGTQYRVESGEQFPELLRDSRGGFVRQAVHFATLLLSILFLAGAISRILKEANCDADGKLVALVLWTVCAAEYLLLFQIGAWLRWDVLTEATVRFGPFALLFEENSLYLPAANWGLVILFMAAAVLRSAHHGADPAQR